MKNINFASSAISNIFKFSSKVPKPVGPYSAFREVKALETTIYVSGCLGIHPKDLKLVSNDINGQFKQAMENLKHVLESAHYTMKDIKKTTVFLTDISQYSTMNEIYKSYFGDVFPARSAIVVMALPLNGLVEIEAIASKNHE